MSIHASRYLVLRRQHQVPDPTEESLSTDQKIREEQMRYLPATFNVSSGHIRGSSPLEDIPEQRPISFTTYRTKMSQYSWQKFQEWTRKNSLTEPDACPLTLEWICPDGCQIFTYFTIKDYKTFYEPSHICPWCLSQNDASQRMQISPEGKEAMGHFERFGEFEELFSSKRAQFDLESMDLWKPILGSDLREPPQFDDSIGPGMPLGCTPTHQTELLKYKKIDYELSFLNNQTWGENSNETLMYFDCRSEIQLLWICPFNHPPFLGRMVDIVEGTQQCPKCSKASTT